MPRTLTYAGKNLSDFSVWWDNSRIFNKPAKLFDSFSIPNRNGALLTSLRKFENIQIEYDCYIKDNFASNYADLVDYLTSFETYQRLENSEEPYTYRMGVFRAEISTETGQFLKDGRFTLVFDCKPQNFFNSGDELTQLKLEVLGNQWAGQSFTLSGVHVIFDNTGKIYTAQGTLSTTTQTYSTNIPIPSAGTWDIEARVISPDHQGGQRVYMTLEGVNRRLNEANRIITTKTTTGSSSVTFGMTSMNGVETTLAARVACMMTKRADTTMLENPSRKEAKPLFVYNDVGHSASAKINGSTVFTYTPPTGASDSDGTLYVDCELMDCYLLKSDGTVANYNPYVTMTDFPKLQEGTSRAVTTYGTMYIKPRWWRL